MMCVGFFSFLYTYARAGIVSLFSRDAICVWHPPNKNIKHETDAAPAQVHMTLTGPVVLDIVQHFTERWNEIKKRKYKDIAYVFFFFCSFAFPPLLPFVSKLGDVADARPPPRKGWRRADGVQRPTLGGYGAEVEAEAEVGA
jgi:hypothetical protein